MTRPFSVREEQRLASCHVDLQRVVRRVHRERMSLLVICGHRDEEDQNAAFTAGTSKLKWPHSRHNSYPSEAIDLAPDPLDWKDLERFSELSEHMLDIADEEEVFLVWGGAWTNFSDKPHYELEKF